MNEQLQVEISAEVKEFIDALKDAVAVLKDLQGELDDTDDKTKQTGKQTKKAGKQVKKGWEDAKKAVKDFNDQVQKVGEVCKKVLTFAATAAVGLATALLATSAATEEYRTNQAKLNTAFQNAGLTANEASQTYKDLYRVLGDDGKAVEAANHLSQLGTNQRQLSQWTMICQGAYATFGDSLPIESLTEAANETAKTGQLTGALADALNWAGVNEDDFRAKLEACNNEQEREALIRRTLLGLYGEAAGAYEKNAAALLAQHEAEMRLNEQMAILGATMQPVNTMLTNLAATVLEQLNPYISALAEQYMPVLQQAFADAGTKIGEFITWIADNWETLVKLGEVILIIASAFTVFSAVMSVVNFVMAACPVTWIVLGIVALIAVIAICIVYWEEISAAMSEAWDSALNWLNQQGTIGEMCAKALTAAKDTVMDGLDKIKQAYEENGGGIKGVVAGYLAAVNAFWTSGFTYIDNLTGNKLTAIRDSIASKLGEAKAKAASVLESLKSTFSTKLSSAWATATSIFNNIKSGITEKITAAKEAVSTAIQNIKEFFNFSWSLPELKMPKITIEGEFSLSPISVPHFAISWNAMGGVFDTPTIFGSANGLQGIGEDGAEAVVPLENNLGWLDKLAGMLDERMNKRGSTPVILEVDGKVFAQTSIDTINTLTRQTGQLALNIV